MGNESLKLLEELTQADAVPGHEDEVRAIFLRELDGLGTIERDGIGSVACIREGSASSPRVLLDSHMDEVGFLVQRVTSQGFVKFVPAGGWWAHTLLAQRVRIKTKNGKIPGVIGSTPPHLLGKGARDRVLGIDQLYVDIGAESAEQATEEFGVHPGQPIAPYAPFERMHNPKLMSAKAFDNRVGVAIAIAVMKRMTELTSGQPNTLIVTGCVQEEVGLRGARAFTPQLKPDVAIVLEGPPADDLPGTPAESMQGRLGGGAQIRLADPSMIANPRLADLAIETARSEGIPYQVAVRSSGGTDGGAIHQAPGGVPTIVLGVPARYIHSHVSIVHEDDFTATLELTKALVAKLDAATVAALAG